MFINKMKEQLLPSEKGCGLAPPHYPTLLTVPTSVALPTNISMDSDTKPEQLTPHSQASVTQNITVVPVQSAGLMTAGERNTEGAVVTFWPFKTNEILSYPRLILMIQSNVGAKVYRC